MNTYYRCHVDDAAMLLLAHHDRCAGMDEVESRLQVYGNDGIPLPSVIRIISPSFVIPALFTSISILPKSAFTCLTTSLSVRSQQHCEAYPLAFTPLAAISFLSAFTVLINH
jgi:hypothetical protein